MGIPLENAPAANTAATVSTPSPAAGEAVTLKALEISYSAAPTGGNVIVQDGATTVMSVDITAAGPQSIPLPDDHEGLTITPGNALTVTLAAGGAAVLGKVSIEYVVGAPA